MVAIKFANRQARGIGGGTDRARGKLRTRLARAGHPTGSGGHSASGLYPPTDCGLQSITDDGFRAELERATGTPPPFAIESFTDVDANVRQSILRIRRSPFLLHRDRVRGFVYDVDAGVLRQIDA